MQSEMTNNIYGVCTQVRKSGMTAGVILTAVWAALYFLLLDGNFEDLFYGINRIHLLVFAIGIGYVLLNVFCIITGFDKRNIRKQVSAMGISLEQFENNMSKGCVYSKAGASDVFVLSSVYCLFRSNGFFHVIRTDDIMKLGVDVFGNGKNRTERMHCLTRDGNVYTIDMPIEKTMELTGNLCELLQTQINW